MTDLAKRTAAALHRTEAALERHTTRPVLPTVVRAAACRYYDRAALSVLGERSLLCPEGMVRILNAEGFKYLGLVEGMEPYNAVVRHETLGLYLVGLRP